MCLNMDYETDKPIFTVKQSLNCLLAIEVNEVCLMLENLVSLLRAGSWNWLIVGSFSTLTSL